MRRTKGSLSLVLVGLVTMFLFAMASSAFAAYSQTFSIASPITPGSSVTFNPTFNKVTGDPGGASTMYMQVKVTGLASAGDVVGAAAGAGGAWYPPVPTQTGPGFVYYVANQYVDWTGNQAVTNPLDGVPNLTFAAPGNYTVQVDLAKDPTDGIYPAHGTDVVQSSVYSVRVAAPVVSTPASSPWSIAILALGALGAFAWFGRSRLTSAGRS
jgi:hypothetical protein